VSSEEEDQLEKKRRLIMSVPKSFSECRGVRLGVASGALVSLLVP